jgi:hypothetical protein
MSRRCRVNSALLNVAAVHFTKLLVQSCCQLSQPCCGGVNLAYISFILHACSGCHLHQALLHCECCSLLPLSCRCCTYRCTLPCTCFTPRCTLRCTLHCTLLCTLLCTLRYTRSSAAAAAHLSSILRACVTSSGFSKMYPPCSTICTAQQWQHWQSWDYMQQPATHQICLSLTQCALAPSACIHAALVCSVLYAPRPGTALAVQMREPHNNKRGTCLLLCRCVRWCKQACQAAGHAITWQNIQPVQNAA